MIRQTDCHSVGNNQFEHGNKVYTNKIFYWTNSGNRKFHRNRDSVHSNDSDRVEFYNICKKFGHFNSECF